MILSCNNICKSFGSDDIIKNASFHIEDHEKAAIVGINGAGKSTFLKILSGELEPTKGEIIMDPGERLSILKQDHFQYDAYPVLDTVIMGNQRL